MAKKKIGKENMNYIKGGKQLEIQPVVNSNKTKPSNEFAELTKIGKDLMDNFFGDT
tara:strand:- start:889 stop:1056 length:168 start_codon:yes stop_codon:yes gene_type:complete